MYRLYGKRIFDLVVTSVLLLVLSPLIFSVYILLVFVNRGSALFFQERPGKGLAKFRIVKFKTMSDEKDSNGNLLPDIQRLTPLGKWIRKLSIDELPQLVNVMKGEMSLIGPRPLLFRYIPLYSSSQMRRHEVLPGITGWAQVNGRNGISWSRRFELDLYYIENMSFSLDCKIIWLTILKVFKREGINQSAFRPMEPFNGTN